MPGPPDVQSHFPEDTQLPQNATIETIAASRLSCHFDDSYDVIVERFRKLVPRIDLPRLRSQTSPEGIAAVVDETASPTGFCLFVEFNHGAWISYFPAAQSDPLASEDKVVHNSASIHRFIFGNPLFAITMIRHDVESALHVPLDCLFSKQKDGSTKLVMLLPRGTIAGRAEVSSNEKLKRAVNGLEEKLFNLIEMLKG